MRGANMGIKSRRWLLALAALAFASQPVVAKLQFTNTWWDLHVGTPFEITWNGDDLSFPVVIRLYDSRYSDFTTDSFVSWIACEYALD
jgi:hypothetical protein